MIIGKNLLIGSRAHGKPREDSDVDLVLLVDRSVMMALIDIADIAHTLRDDEASCHIGKLNAVVTCSEAVFESWRRGVELLEQKAPVTRDVAIATYTKQRKVDGVPFIYELDTRAFDHVRADELSPSMRARFYGGGYPPECAASRTDALAHAMGES